MIKYIFLSICVVSFSIYAYFYFTPSLINKKSASTIISSIQKTKEIDKLYTGVYHIPVIDKTKGFLKRDMLTYGAQVYLDPLDAVYKLYKGQSLEIDKNKQVVQGYCFKKYEVSFGYDNLLMILENSAILDSVCSNKTASLPNPEILAVNCKNTDIKGKYGSNGMCYGWDSNDSERKRIIKQFMLEHGIMEKVNERGKESLKNFLSVFCN